MSADRYGTILVVDDNAATLYSTSRVLRAAGYEVMEAATGGQALALAARRPDLVVLDVNLPDIDGFEVCRRLRTRQETARTPVVHLSATFVRDADKVHGLEAGADGYLTHPVEPPVLVATVRAALIVVQRLREAARGPQPFLVHVPKDAIDVWHGGTSARFGPQRAVGQLERLALVDLYRLAEQVVER